MVEGLAQGAAAAAAGLETTAAFGRLVVDGVGAAYVG